MPLVALIIIKIYNNQCKTFMLRFPRAGDHSRSIEHVEKFVSSYASFIAREEFRSQCQKLRWYRLQMSDDVYGSIKTLVYQRRTKLPEQNSSRHHAA